MFMVIISRSMPRIKVRGVVSKIRQEWQTELWKDTLTDFSRGNYFFFLVKKKIYELLKGLIVNYPTSEEMFSRKHL